MDILIGQLLALLTFFLFPVIQFLILKYHSRHEGLPELWYLPDYGFRLVIRNMGRPRNLYDVKYHAYIREKTEKSSGSSVGASIYSTLERDESPVLLNGYDKVMVCFNLIGRSKEELEFAHTDSHGIVLTQSPVQENKSVIVEYSAMIDNGFNFDIRVLKRIEINFSEMINLYIATNSGFPEEQRFELQNVESAGN